jgi:hypothetical protein
MELPKMGKFKIQLFSLILVIPALLQPTSVLAQATVKADERITGEAATPSADVGIASIPSPFTASPFANDFVTTGAEGGTAHYVPSNGDGTFGPQSTIPDLTTVDGTDVADMDGDGDNDFLSCEGTTGEVFLYTNNGGGSFTPIVVASGVTSTGFCTNLRIADFNNDGMNDFVVGDNQNFLGTKVYVQGPVGTFSVSTTLDTSWTDTGNNLFGVAAGDLSGDGNADILMLGYEGLGAGQVQFYAGDGAGNFATSTLLFNLGDDFGVFGGNGLAIFDLEGDGDLDIVVGGGFSGPAGGGEHFIYTNNGSGNFTAPSTFTFQIDTAQTGVDAFDADGDGDHDLVVAAFGPGTLSYVQNLGGTLAAPVVVASLDGPSIGVGAPPLQPVVVNDLVTFEPIPSSFAFTPDPTGCPTEFIGTFSFDARLSNISERSLTDLVVVVTTLTNGNLLQNADGGPGGVGARLTVPRQDGFADGRLTPDEFVDVPFIICLTTQEPFRLVVDVLGEAE